MKNHGNHQNRKFVSRDLLTVVLIFTGIMIFVVGIGLTRQISGSFERNSSEYLQSITRQSAENTAQQMKEAIGQIKMVADLVAEDGERTDDILREAAEDGLFSEIAAVDENGSVYGAGGTETRQDQTARLTDFFQREGQSVFTYTDERGNVMLTVQVPVYRDGSFAGAVCGSSAVESMFSSSFTEISRGERLGCLLDGSGKFLMSAGSDFGEGAAEANFSDYVDPLLEGNRKEENTFDALLQDLEDGQTGARALLLSGNPYTVCYSPVEGTDSWYVLSFSPNVFFEGTGHRVAAYLFILCGLVLLAALILAFIWNAKLRAKWELGVMEAELDHANLANKAKSDFLSSMSHELRTPMNAIVGITTLAKRSVGDAEKTLDYLHRLEISTTYMLSLINDILDMSRIERGKVVLYRITFDLYDLVEAVDAMIRQISSEKGQRFDVHIDVTHNYITCDKARFQQIIVNMLNNAVKYTGNGGTIRLVIEERGTENGKVRLYVEVADTGIGIREEDMQRIFEPFEEASDKDKSGASGAYGTGLGLSISQNLLKMMGSRMHVSSVSGVGSVFFFEIDLDYAEDGEKVIPIGCCGSWELSGRRVLVAEDNDMNRDMLMDLLCDEGMVCDPASDGEQALKLFTDSKSGTYDVILMDIQMPRMDGLETTKRIRRSDHADARSIPIIAMTAYAFTEDIERSLGAGMSAYASKPVDIMELCKLLNKLISEREKSA